MTAQDLKDSRNQIINRISEIGDAQKAKEIMTAMLRMVEAEMNETSSPVDLVDEVIEMNETWKKVKSHDIQNDIEDIRKKAFYAQRPSSMR